MNAFTANNMVKLVVAAALSFCVLTAWSAGGPPLVTDDPGTPGDGHWEINLATITQRTVGGYSVAVPDADINYGLGEHLQLKADLPWTYSQQSGGDWKCGPGFANYGVKWRFMDEDEVGVDVSTYPQYAYSLSNASIERGIAPAGGQFFLPVEVSGKLNGFDLDGEVGRNFVQQGANQWMAGFVVGHDCAPDVECLAEVHETYTESSAALRANTQTLLNLGLTWKLTESLSLLAAAGRELGKQNPNQLQSLLYVGIQIIH